MTILVRWVVAAILLVTANMAPVVATETATPAKPRASLAELAARSDVIVLAQVRDTDYIYRREFPVEGSAFFRVLIPYKVDEPLDYIEIYETGLHANECYFPNPTVFEEGRRYLLFLREDQEKPGRFRGLAEGCALEVLVAANSRYVLRMPVTGIELTDPLPVYAEPFAFNDSYAKENDESLNSEKRDALLAGGWIKPWEDGYIYTRGIELATVRKLMGEAGLSVRRHHQEPQ